MKQAAPAVPAPSSISPTVWSHLVRDHNMAPSYRFVALALATYADADGHSVHPTRARLMELTGLPEKTIKNALERLQALGLIRLVHRPTGPGDAAVYRLSLPLDSFGRRRRNTPKSGPHTRAALKLARPT